MGGGSWDSSTYHTSTATRRSAGIADFAYTATATSVHPNLDPRRINSKPFGRLESRDSTEHPESNAVLVSFDVTGSNRARAVDAQKVLPSLMGLLGKYLTDPQVAFAANDDVNFTSAAVQISDFESDIRIDEHLRNIWLVGLGGGNNGESYDLILYAAARKTVLDCYEKRGRKGYLFMYADEPIFDKVKAREVKSVFGDDIQGDIPIAEIIEEARKLYHVYIIWPIGGYDNAREQFNHLFGEEYVLELQHPNLICELIGSTVGMNEKDLSPDDVVKDLVSVGVDKSSATALVGTSLSKIQKAASATGELAKSSGVKAARI